MNGRIEVVIGNQEIVNLLVEEQVSRLRKEIGKMLDERSALIAEGEAFVARVYDVQVQPVLDKLNSQENTLAVRAGIEAITGCPLPLPVKYSVDGNRIYLHHSKRINTVLCRMTYGDGTDECYESLSDSACEVLEIDRRIDITLSDVARREMKERQAKIDELSATMHSVENRIAKRDDIAREALARITSATIASNPEIMEQVRGIAGLVASLDAKLLS